MLTYTQGMLEQQDVMRKQLEHHKTLLDREKVWRETQHTEEIEALKARYEGRIQQLSAEATQGKSLDGIMQTVATSAEQLRSLGVALEKERECNLEEKEAAYRARAALLQDKETRLAALAKQIEKDRASGLSLQLSIEHMSEQASSSLEQERARLSQEHSRLERMQRSLETERQLVKEMLASELKRMEEERGVRAREHEALVSEISRERKALSEQRSALLHQEADMRRRHEAESKVLSLLALLDLLVQKSRY
jgi:hypothetical protein